MAASICRKSSKGPPRSRGRGPRDSGGDGAAEAERVPHRQHPVADALSCPNCRSSRPSGASQASILRRARSVLASVRLPTEVTYNPRMAIKAGIISMVGCWMAIWLSRLRPRHIPFLRWPATAATLLGLTIVAAHYTAVGAVVLSPKAVVLRPKFTAAGSFLSGIAAAAIVTVFVVVAALIAVADRRILRSSGQSISAKVISFCSKRVPSAFTRLTWTDGFLDINGPCARLWGHPSRLQACRRQHPINSRTQMNSRPCCSRFYRMKKPPARSFV